MDRQSRLVRVGRAAARPFVAWVRYRPAMFQLGGLRTAVVCSVYMVVAISVLILYTDYTDLEPSSPVLQGVIAAVIVQALFAAVDFALARPLLARKKRKQQELTLPLVASGDPALAERLDEHLDGFGER